jgi:sterol 3beta-glucosyltransferase
VSRSGRPSILLPFLEEHAIWGRELFRLGIAARPIRSRRAAPERLARAIRAVLADGEMCRRAARVGERLRTEDGVRRAVELLEQEL